MRHSIAVLISLLVLILNTPSLAADNAGHAFDWVQWRYLAVQSGGRQKPLDTLAWETLRIVANRAGFTDPETDQKLDATALYLVMLFDWQGWDRPPDPHSLIGIHSPSAYFDHHQADKWDNAPLLRVDYLKLREALRIADGPKHISPLELSRADVRDPDTGKKASFLTWAEKLARNKQDGFTTFEKKALELANKFWTYQNHRMGLGLEVMPIRGSKHQEWIPVAYLWQTDFDDQTDPAGKMRKAKQQFQKVRKAYHAGSPETFNRASAAFIAAVRDLGPRLGPYPAQEKIDLEVAYNHWVPFRFAWVFTLLAFICVLFAMGTGWKFFYAGGLATFSAGLVAMLIGFAVRIEIAGRAPVTNMYESVTYVGLGIAVIGLILELIYRRRFVLAAAAAVSTLTLILADNCPAILDPSLRPLEPVLRSNFWLVIHVMSITLSYAAFALALGIANITLGYYLVRSRNQETIKALGNFTYKTLQVGVLLLAAGTILGGVWADYAWGRFWGWDPKEVWALIALLGYLAVLHARYVGWVRDFGLAASSAICFSLVVMAWYGVNVLGAGLHNYGFGFAGGLFYIIGAVVVQLLYVLAAAAVELTGNGSAAPPQEPSLPTAVDA